MFVDYGMLLAPLLRKAISQGIEPEYAAKLLAIIETEAQRKPRHAASVISSTVGTLSEHVTEKCAGGHRYLLATQTVSQHPHDRRQDNAGQGEQWHQQPYFGVGNPELAHHLWGYRIYAGHAEHCHQRYRKDNMEISIPECLLVWIIIELWHYLENNPFPVTLNEVKGLPRGRFSANAQNDSTINFHRLWVALA
jgi:hypothetical protein